MAFVKFSLPVFITLVIGVAGVIIWLAVVRKKNTAADAGQHTGSGGELPSHTASPGMPTLQATAIAASAMEYVTGTIEKPTTGTMTGMAVTSSQHGSATTLIRSIAPHSLFAATDLRPGLVIVSINNEQVVSAGQAAALIRSCPPGLLLSILAATKQVEQKGVAVVGSNMSHLKVIATTKSEPQSTTGITLRQLHVVAPRRVYYASQIEDGSGWMNTSNNGTGPLLLRPGAHVIVSINNHHDFATVENAMDTIRDAFPIVTLLVEELVLGDDSTTARSVPHYNDSLPVAEATPIYSSAPPSDQQEIYQI